MKNTYLEEKSNETPKRKHHLHRERRHFFPDLAIPEQTDYPIGKYGQMRLEFLKKHRRGTYTTLLTECRLSTHLSSIDQEARSQVEILTAVLAKQRGIDEKLKAADPLLWVQEMNNCKDSAEEIILQEMIYK